MKTINMKRYDELKEKGLAYDVVDITTNMLMRFVVVENDLIQVNLTV